MLAHLATLQNPRIRRRGRRLALGNLHPALYHLSVAEKRLRRRLYWRFGPLRLAQTTQATPLPVRIHKHQSRLIKGLGDTDERLQRNKVHNLRLAVPHLDGLLIRPGETLSFCQRVGPPSRARGFKEGMELSRGCVRPGVGGGLCQISNLLHWMVLHSPLTVVERHHHSFDAFPDRGRVLPFGSGATVFHNYLDYCVRNDTDQVFQVRLWFSERLLEGELRAERRHRYTWHVFERDHAFVRRPDGWYRRNSLWRRRYDRQAGGQPTGEAHIHDTFARVMYTPSPEALARTTVIDETR